MKLILFLFLLLITFKVLSAQDIYNDFIEKEIQHNSSLAKAQQINYPGDSSFNAVYYKLDITVNHIAENITGIVTVKSRSLKDNLQQIYLDLSDNMIVDSVKDSNTPLSFTHSDSKLNITLRNPILFNDYFGLQIYYHGSPATNGLGSFAFDSHNGSPSIWTLSEPYGAKEWWPCKDTPADKADSSDVWITCSDDLIGVSNGTLESESDNNDGTKTYKWKSRYSIANYLISMAISNYTVYKKYFRYSDQDSMLVVHYIYPEVFESVKSQLDKTVSMLEIFSKVYGEYPFIKEKYGHAQFASGGMEHQTISSMGRFDDAVVSHELAHQWFGDKVTCNDWRNIWLNEGFARYSEGVYLEATQGKETYNSFISEQMSRSKNAKGSIYVKDVEIISQIFSDRSYSKGGIVLHMLRRVTGDSTFFRILRNYLNDPELAYNSASTEDFARVASNTFGSSLTYFFNEWIYGENYPKYRIDWDYSKEDGNTYRIDINVSQAINSYPNFFTMPLPFRITTSAGDTTITLFNNQQDQSFSFLISGKPTDFSFDPENNILKEILLTDPPGFRYPLDYELLQNYPNPFNGITKIQFGVPRRSNVSLSIYDILGNKISTFYNKETDAGNYTVELNTDVINIASGIYFYRLEAEGFTSSKKIVLIK